MVTYADPEPRVAGPYDQVITALWESRLAVDRTMGLEAASRVLGRADSPEQSVAKECAWSPLQPSRS